MSDGCSHLGKIPFVLQDNGEKEKENDLHGVGGKTEARGNEELHTEPSPAPIQAQSRHL
jgi:hypothetical protein